MQAGDCVYVIRDQDIVEAKLMEEFLKGWTTVEIDGKLPAAHESDVYASRIQAEDVLNQRLGSVEMNEQIRVAASMIQHGGGFVKALGDALHKADPGNAARIKAAFPDYWEKYRQMDTTAE